MRNIMEAAPKTLRDEIRGHIRTIFDAPDPKTARLLLDQTLQAYEEKAARAMAILEAGFDDVIAVLSLPQKYHERLRATNSVERLNEEIRRRERVIRIFPNRESVVRLMGALLMEMDEKWSEGKKIFGYARISAF